MTPIAPTSPDTIGHWLEWVAKRLAPADGNEALLGAISAIRTAINLLDRPDRSEATQADVEVVRAALAAAEPAVAAAAAPLALDHVAAGLAHVRIMLAIFGRDSSERVEPALILELDDAIEHAALIADELDAVLRRRSIAARALARQQDPSGAPFAHTMH